MSAEAEVAARWKELTEQKDKAELLWYFLQEQDAGAAVNKVNTQIAAREADLLQGRGELQKLTTQIEVLKEDVRVKREAADKAREAAWQANARVTELEGAIARIITEKDSLAREIANAAESIARRRNERDTAASRLAELAAKEQELRENAEAMTEECAASQESALVLQQECEEKKEAYEKARQAAATHEKRMEVLNLSLIHI